MNSGETAGETERREELRFPQLPDDTRRRRGIQRTEQEVMFSRRRTCEDPEGPRIRDDAALLHQSKEARDHRLS